jgi:hypothetical protein
VEAARHRQWRAKYNALSDAERQKLKSGIEAAASGSALAGGEENGGEADCRSLKPEPRTRTIRAALEHAATAVLKVSNGGRGFVIETGRHERYVITAGHCLSYFPPRFSAADRGVPAGAHLRRNPDCPAFPAPAAVSDTNLTQARKPIFIGFSL